MASITKDQVIDFIANMSVLEMSELVKEMEEDKLKMLPSELRKQKIKVFYLQDWVISLKHTVP